MLKHVPGYVMGLLVLLMLTLSACTLPAQVISTPSDAPQSVDAAADAAADAGADAAADAGASEDESGAAETSEGDAADAITFRIVPESSEARFTIDEVFLGTPQTVVGATQDIAGEIRVSPSNPAASYIGPIEINADTIATDNERRNTAIRRFILQTPDYPTITFTPTTLGNMPDSVAVGDRFTFQVSGDLQIRQFINPVTFDLSLEVVSPTEIVGSGQAVIQRADFELTIPSVPSVTDVSEEIGLALDFVARAE